jgi:hypothetical protein
VLPEAPAFRTLGDEGADAIQAFAADLRRHHPNGMPEILLSDAEAAEVQAYVRSLGSKDPKDRLPSVPPCPLRGC